MGVKFTMRIFKNRAKERFLKNIIKKAEQLLRSNDVNNKPYTVTKYLMLHYYIKALKLAKGIVAVCKKNLDSDAKILFRSLFEIGCYCEYINIESKDIKRADCRDHVARYFSTERMVGRYEEEFMKLV